MSETISGFYYVIHHGPLAIVGFLLIGAAGLLFFRLHTKLDKVGAASYGHFIFPIVLWFAIPRAYLKYAGPNGWSRLPAYAAWCCLGSGISLLTVGLSMLLRLDS